MIWIDVKQSSEEWFTLRRGHPTASRFDQILTPVKETPSASQKKLIAELISEVYSEIPPEGVENFTNRATRWGEECEAHARAYYCLEKGVDVFNGGFCMTEDEALAASPDFLVGLDVTQATEYKVTIRGQTFHGWRGATCKRTGELKCPQGATHAEYILEGTLPSDYKCQCHGHIIVCKPTDDATDFLSYSPGLPPLIVEVKADAFTAKLEAELKKFGAKLVEAMLRFKPAADPAETF